MSSKQDLDQEASPQSPTFACVRCWKLKKKCDKLSPKCSRCSSSSLNCIYSAKPPFERPYSLRSRASDAVPLHPPATQHHDTRKPRTPPLSPPSKIDCSTTSQTCTLQEPLPTLKTRHLFDDFLSAQLSDAFTAVKPKLMSTCNHYLDTINTSLPIIIESQFRNRLANLDVAPDTEFRVLLLSIYLVTEMPVQLPEGGTNLSNLYSILKSFYSNLISIRPPSILIIQAGTLIAVYEQGQAQDLTAYLTIGQCARMGHAMGLHKSLHVDLPSDLSPRDLIETSKHVWWILIILERVLALESLEPNRPFAIDHPTLEDYLPSFYGRDVENFLPVGRTADAGEFSEMFLTPVNSYARTCQATYLLSRVFQHIGDGTKNEAARQAEAAYLDTTLQTFSLFVIDQSNREVDVPWGYSCAAYMMCMVALSALHHYNLFLDSYFSHERWEEQTHRLALYSISRIAIDGATTKMDDRVEGARNAPPFSLHLFREMAILVLQMGYEEGKKTHDLMVEIAILRTYLSIASEKWKLAGRHLDAIEEVAAKLRERKPTI